MSSGVGISLEELLAWSDEAARDWKSHLEVNPAVLELPSGINGAADVRALVRHIWGAEQRWSQRLAGLPTAEFSEGSLFAIHTHAGASGWIPRYGLGRSAVQCSAALR